MAYILKLKLDMGQNLKHSFNPDFEIFSFVFKNIFFFLEAPKAFEASRHFTNKEEKAGFFKSGTMCQV